MKPLPLLGLVLLAGIVAPGWRAATESLQNSLLRSTPAVGAVRMDGDLSAWDHSGAIVLADDAAHPGQLVRVTSCYDPTSFYLAFEFKDQTPMINHVDPEKSPGMGWCGDAVQLRFNLGDVDGGPTLKPVNLVHLDAYWFTDGARPASRLVFGDLSSGGKTVKIVPQAVGHGVELSFRPDADGQGYVQILKIDWKLLCAERGGPYRSGESFRMAIEAMWGDARYREQAAARITDLLNPRRREKELLWANPSAFGTVKFMPEGGLEPSESARLWPTLLAHYTPKTTTAEAQPKTPPPAESPAPDRPCLDEKREVSQLLNRWFAEGTAAGNHGDAYDNRDRGHAELDVKLYPQLRLHTYTPEQKAANADYALSLAVQPQVSFGNSSTSSTPRGGGCNPRHAMMRPDGMALLYQQYRSANLYVYPAHQDFWPGHNGQGLYGDVLPLNSPYTLLSKGSSGSDIPFLKALIQATAALSPQVKATLVKHGLLMPELQALMRVTNKQVATPEDYFTGKTHPPVFRGDQLDELKLAQAAHAVTPETILPLALLRVVAEDPLTPGVNAPEGTPSEKLCDTPAVVGRVFRRWGRAMSLTVSAADSYDWKGRALRFRWALLQGDPSRVRIEPTADGREARLTITWHDRFPIAPGDALDTNRVDIGVFASTGEGWSAPAFVSVDFPDNQLRTYDEHDRLVDIYYAAGDTRIGFDTPVLLPAEGSAPYPVRDWPRLLKLASGRGESVAAKLFQTALNPPERDAVATTAAELSALTAKLAEQRAAHPPTNLYARWKAAKEDSTECGKTLLKVATTGRSPKAMIEDALNAWKDDPTTYLRQRAAIDEEAARRGPEAVAQLAHARQRLIDLGIYQPAEGGGWSLHSVRGGTAPVTERLTRYERLELRRFQLELLTKIVLPGVVMRDYDRNYVDHRMETEKPLWLTFDYGKGDAPTAVHARTTDAFSFDQPLEDP
ncbi:MAG: hypothetical protein WC661_21835 [Opitutaceae bacterium]